MPRDPEPLVSCVMVTHATRDRLALIAKSVRCFARQSYAPRELVVVADSPSAADRQALETLLAETTTQPVRVIVPARKTTLGGLRNLSVEHARGELVCQWDDDDLAHPDRLIAQVAELERTGADAVYLQNVCHLFRDAGVVYASNWSSTKLGCHPATLLVRRELARGYPEDGPDAHKGEDRVALDRLRQLGRVAVLDAPAYLYLYCFHGTNTWNADHHAMLARRTAEPSQATHARRTEIMHALAELDHGCARVRVLSRTGFAFEWVAAA